MKTSEAGLSLIKSFEGLRLTSYYCPSNVLSIGWGHTGSDVYDGLTITEDQAEVLLKDDLASFENAVLGVIQPSLTQEQFDSLVSFAFNCGTGALRSSTMARRINAGEPICLVLSEELPRWVNGANGPLEGLVRRRDAEVEHACGGETEEVRDDFILDAVKYYANEPHQTEAFLGLWAHLEPELQNWFKTAYRNDSSAFVPHDSPGQPGLNVPYFYQHDSATSHGGRMCFTSSMAMALDYIDPEVLAGDDDWYLNIVLYYGDTVSSEAQIKAATSLGYDASFHTDGNIDKLKSLLDLNVPVPVGILHHGPVERPTGGGHWICLLGYDDTHFLVHDPAGELDLINGSYPKSGPTDGEGVRYTQKNLMKRWLIENDHDGWYVDLS